MKIRNKNNKISILNLFMIIVVSIFLGGGLFVSASNIGNLITKTVDNKDTFVSQEFIRVVNEESQVIEVVKKASPAVVSIIATAEVPKFETYYDRPLSELPDELQEYFSIPQRRENGTERVRVGAGSGFLVSGDGYIITNKHVVEDGDAEYTVFLNDEEHKSEKVSAKVLARSPNTDLAVMKINMTGLPYLEFSDSANLSVGQSAITIGFALGQYDNTVSRGVVSGLSRSIVAGGIWGQASERLTDLIQTDAAINPGNSGGPMLDISGRVIGVNVAMASAENIGFAILGNTAKETFEEVLSTGEIKKVETAFLGVRYTLITPSLKENNNLPYNYGALIVEGETALDLAIVPGSPADKAGFNEGTIILEVDGKKINERNMLIDAISDFSPGDEVELLIFQSGEEKKVKLKLEKSE